MAETLKAGARTAVLVPLFFLYTMVCALVVIVVGAMRPKAAIINRTVDHWATLFLHIPPARIRIEGLENVDPSQRYVVIANHLSLFDIPLLLSVLPLAGRFLSKKEIFRIPLVGRAMRTIGIIEIDREAGGGSSRDAINRGVTIAAERGYSLIVFPEGTRSRDSELIPFKKGAFRIAIDTQLPVLPVVHEGTDRISRPDSKIYHPGTIRVRILPAVPTAGMTNRDNLNTLVREVEADIVEAYAVLRTPSAG
jgi:1-acyl-sn-glycerol-3-phosphate acyltransferase